MSTKPKPPAGLKLAIDYGPMLAFFLAYRLWHPAKSAPDGVGEVLAITKSTGVFVVATLAALVVSKWRLGRVAPMLWLSSALVVFFGGLTIAFHNATFVQIKPTVIYVLSGGALLAGVWRGTPLLKILLDDAFAGLSERGWMILSRNWGWFFLGLAVLNEVLRQIYNQAHGNLDTWIALKLYLFMPLSFVFTFAHMPLLMKHGLGQEQPDA
jgi:intracellular septation protein